jgi:ABC-2 type transport system permease protein
MLTRIIKHEWRLLLVDHVAQLVTLIFGLSMAYGMFNGVAWVRFQEATLERASRDESLRYEGLRAELDSIEHSAKEPSWWDDPRHAEVVAVIRGQRFACMPPAPLAAMAIGRSDLDPYYFKITGLGRQALLNDHEIMNPTHLLTGRFDLGFVVLALFPLIILALSYDLISGEREGGTLALALSQPVQLRTLVVGKVLSRGTFVLVLALTTAMMGVLAGGVNPLNAGVAARLCLWGLVVAAYGSFWFCLAVVVNAAGGRSSTNAVVLTSLWLTFVVVIPTLVNVALASLYPVPSRVELIGAMQAASSAATARGSGLLSQFYQDHPGLVPAAPEVKENFSIAYMAVQNSIDAAVEPILSTFDRQLERQQTTAERLRWLSPTILAQTALLDLAGTGRARYRHFLNQVNSYHQEWRAFFNPKVFRRERLTRRDYDRIPEFHFNEESTSDVVCGILKSSLELAVPSLFLLPLGSWVLRRYRVGQEPI